MKLRPNQLKIGKTYFLIDYDKDVVVEGVFYNHDLYKNKESYDFKHSITIDADGHEDHQAIYPDLKNGVLKENVGDRDDDAWIENPIFSTREEAEARKNKYILKSLREVRKLILKELKENSEQIKKIKGE